MSQPLSLGEGARAEATSGASAGSGATSRGASARAHLASTGAPGVSVHPVIVRGRWLVWVLLGASALLIPLGTAVGSMGLENLWPWLWPHSLDAADPAASAQRAMAWQIVTDIRLPRTWVHRL